MKIVTGYTGEAHITSADDQARNRAVFGSGNCVLNTGNRFSAALASTTTVQIADGDGMLQGVHFRIETGLVETLTISNGASGFNRNDLIVARYQKDSGTGIESVEMVVIEGTASATTAADPEYNTGVIAEGASIVDFPLYRVKLAGLTPTLENLFASSVSPGGVVDQIYPVGSIYMSVNATDPALLFGGTWERWGVGRVPVGLDPNDADFNAAGKYGGDKEVDGTLHFHAIIGEVVEVASGHGAMVAGPGGGNDNFGMVTDYDQTHASTGNMPPYIVCYMWTRTA